MPIKMKKQKTFFHFAALNCQEITTKKKKPHSNRM